MVGENIQRAREDLQFMRRQLLSGLRLGGKSFSSNPGILANFRVGRYVQERLQAVRRTTNRPPVTRTKREEEKISIDRPEKIQERVMSV